MVALDQLFERCFDDFHVVRRDVYVLHLRRHVFKRLDAEIAAGARVGSGFVLDHFLRPLYVDGQTTLLRRLVDADKGSISLINIASVLSATPGLVTRARYIGAARRHHVENDLPSPELEVLNEGFDRWAGAGEDAVPTSRLEALRDAIAGDFEKVRHYVNKVVAHRDRRERPALTWGEVDAAIEASGEHLGDVGLLLTGQLWFPDPAIAPDWEKAFATGYFVPSIEFWVREATWSPSFS